MRISDQEILAFAADVFGVPKAALSLESTFRSIPEWDSLAQVRLVMEATSRFGVTIPLEEIVSVTSLWELSRRIKGESVKKVLALDLDGVLWNGVIGEDGAAGVVPREAFQREVVALRARGVLLVALSKNNLSDVANLPGLLSWDDFAAREIGWAPKADGLLRIAETLNLGLDAFVFVDDNPVERAEMLAKLPDVTVVGATACLGAYFPPRELTAEDLEKTEQYQAEAKRRAFLQGRTEDEWLADLKIRTEIAPLAAADVARVAQLSQKANQFRLTPTRRTAEEVRAWLSDGSSVTLVARSRDRFGDMGLIAFAHARMEKGTAFVEDFTMSCRAMGRRIELALKNALASALQDRGCTQIKAEFVPTGRNEPARSLYADA